MLLRGKRKEIGKRLGGGIGVGPETRVHTRQTRAATADEAVERIDGAGYSSPKLTQTSGHAKPGMARKATKEVEHSEEKCDQLGNSRTRVSTRAASRCNGPIIAGTKESHEISETLPPSTTAERWTERQEKALFESIATIKPGVNFWRLIADQVPGKTAEDCFKKFYSGRTATRAAKRSRTEEKVVSSSAKRNGPDRVRSLRTDGPVNDKTPGPETRPIVKAITKGPPVENESKRRNRSTITQQTRLPPERSSKRRRIEEASGNSLSAEQSQAKAAQSVAKAAQKSMLSRRATKGSKKKTEKEDQVRAGSAQGGITGAPGTDPQSPVSEDGHKQIASTSAEGAPLNEDDDHDVWTKVQETALQDAYSTIRPSANFWHLISKRVPGRTAEECFNKFYAGHPTPPRVALRSGAKDFDCPPSSVPDRPKAKKTTKGKRLLEAHRTVRNILRRQQVDNEDYEADAFAALEPPDVVHSVMEKAKGVLESDKETYKLKLGGQNSNRGFGLIRHAEVFSPEVLKRVKDPSLLDKYIDHLHQRRSRRAGTKSALKKKASNGLYELSKDGLDFREVRMDAIHRAKQELRDVFLKSGSAVDEPFLDLVDDDNPFDKDSNEDDDESVDIQLVL